MNKELPHTLKITTLWLLLITGVFLAFQAWEHTKKQPRIALHGPQGVTIPRSPDGHFHWPGTVNGLEADFLVDTGATATALPERLARQLGLAPIGRVQSHTAGGVVEGFITVADVQLRGGVSAERLRVTVLPGLEAPLLGMDVLSKLQFRQSAGELHIEAHE